MRAPGGARTFATRTFATRTAELAVRSLLREAEAAPKPGLVDRFGPGSHSDMGIGHFRLSAAALEPYFARMAEEREPERLRDLGIEAEAAMLAATGGVNTHKGAIWALGLLCAAAGTLRDRAPRDRALGAEAVCDEAAVVAAGITALPGRPGGSVTREVPGRAEATHGEAARRDHGLRSAACEALAGFPSIRAAALPLARRLARSGAQDATDARAGEDEAVILVLLAAMTATDDTCVVARGGLESLGLARSMAREVLDAGGPRSDSGAPAYARMIAEFSARRLSPGGSADMCAAALFLADLENLGAACRALPRAI